MQDAIIKSVHGRSVWDSRGRPTVEVEIELSSGKMGRCIAPAGASRGKREAVDLRDGGRRLGGMGVDNAVHIINTKLAELLIGMNAYDQRSIDKALIDYDGTAQKINIGGNSTVAISGAVAWAVAAEKDIPLWQHLNTLYQENTDSKTITPQISTPQISTPMIQIFGGGAHAGNRIDIQDFLVICNGAKTFAQAVEWTAEVYLAARDIMQKKGLVYGVCDEGGLWPEFTHNETPLDIITQAIHKTGLKAGDDVCIALDVAASEFFKDNVYRFALENKDYSTLEFIKVLQGWCANYPIVSLEDPLAEDDLDGFVAITDLLGKQVQIVGDDLLTSNMQEIKKSGDKKACNTVLLKANQCGTISELIDASQTARAYGWNAVMSGRSGESEDVTLSHLAVGMASDQIKVGSMTRSERTCKWNEMIRIEEQNSNLQHWTFQLPQ